MAQRDDGGLTPLIFKSELYLNSPYLPNYQHPTLQQNQRRAIYYPMDIETVLFALACIFLIAVSAVIRIWFKRHQETLSRYNSVKQSDLVIPPTLHPVFDPSRCIGSGACTHVCHIDPTH